jgi:hypothetical protein
VIVTGHDLRYADARFGRHAGMADVLGGRMLQEPIQNAGPVEPGYDGEPPGDGGGLEPADLLHPPDVQLQVRPLGGQRVQAALGAPGQVAAQVGFGVLAGGALGYAADGALASWVQRGLDFVSGLPAKPVRASS